MKLDDEIDRLYQLPLKEFTPARNAVAKQVGGAEATAVRALQKPTVPAWAVSQLYWRQRDVYDQLIDAAERLRKAHHALLAGKSVDLHAAETAHRDKTRTAAQRIRQILTEAGESASDANISAISETLEALPSADEKPGRLTRPLKPMGFEALAGIAPRAASASPTKLALVRSRDQAASPPKPALSEAKKREIEEIETRLRSAQTEERQLLAEIDRTRRELQRAETTQQRVEEELAEATAKVRQCQTDLAEREKAQKAAATAQARLEQRLAKLARTN